MATPVLVDRPDHPALMALMARRERQDQQAPPARTAHRAIQDPPALPARMVGRVLQDLPARQDLPAPLALAARRVDSLALRARQAHREPMERQVPKGLQDHPVRMAIQALKDHRGQQGRRVRTRTGVDLAAGTALPETQDPLATPAQEETPARRGQTAIRDHPDSRVRQARMVIRGRPVRLVQLRLCPVPKDHRATTARTATMVPMATQGLVDGQDHRGRTERREKRGHRARMVRTATPGRLAREASPDRRALTATTAHRERREPMARPARTETPALVATLAPPDHPARTATPDHPERPRPWQGHPARPDRTATTAREGRREPMASTAFPAMLAPPGSLAHRARTVPQDQPAHRAIRDRQVRRVRVAKQAALPANQAPKDQQDNRGPQAPKVQPARPAPTAPKVLQDHPAQTRPEGAHAETQGHPETTARRATPATRGCKALREWTARTATPDHPASMAATATQATPDLAATQALRVSMGTTATPDHPDVTGVTAHRATPARRGRIRLWPARRDHPEPQAPPAATATPALAASRDRRALTAPPEAKDLAERREIKVTPARQAAGQSRRLAPPSASTQAHLAARHCRHCRTFYRFGSNTVGVATTTSSVDDMAEVGHRLAARPTPPIAGRGWRLHHHRPEPRPRRHASLERRSHQRHEH